MNTLAVRNPRTGALDYTLAVDDEASIALKVAQLKRNQGAWERSGIAARVAALSGFRDALARRRSEIIEALTVDTGRLRESEMEVDAALASLARWVVRAPDLMPRTDTRPSVVPPMTLTPASVPLGVVAVISPWNFPFLLALIDAIPALAAGCSVVLKPSEVTPRFIAPLRAALAEVPALARVLAVVAGGPQTGAAMIDHADAVCFTGSVATGRVIAAHAARRLIACYLELGGKDAVIVLASADVVHAAKAVAWGGLANAGQSCLSVERIYVEVPIYDAFVAALAAEVSRLTLNVGAVGVGHIGPIIAKRQATVIQSQLDDAFAKGARALVGGRIVQHGGLWCEPTVLVDVSHDMRVMTEETFGPLLPVMRVGDAAEAIALANGTEYGLSGAVLGEPNAARDVAQQLACGAISINDAALTAIVHDGEKQAFKASGLGPTRMGDGSIARFRRQRVLIEKPTLKDDPWWFR